MWTRGTTGRRRVAMLATGVALLLDGCTSGPDSDGGTFEFVARDGGREFSYPVGDRRPLPSLSGPDLADEARTIAVGDFGGRVVVLNFWATWCAQCRDEVIDLTTADDHLADEQVQFLGIAVRDSRSAAGDFVAGRHVTYPSIFDPSMRTVLAIRGYPMTGIPSTVVLDRQGRVAQIWMRAVSSTELVAAVTAIATE